MDHAAALERELKQPKRGFLMLTRVLMKYLEQKDPNMHARAKDVIKDCADKNKKKEPGYQSLTLAMQRRLRETVGGFYMKKAEDYLNHFIKEKMLQHKKQQDKIKYPDNWVVVKETYPYNSDCHLYQPQMSDEEFISKMKRELLGNRDGYADRYAAVEVMMDATSKPMRCDNDEEISISVMRSSEMKRKEAADKKTILDNARKVAVRKACSDYDCWVVVKDTYPSSLRQQPRTSSDAESSSPIIERKNLGKRKDKDAAIKRAKWFLNNLTCFQDWGPKFYGDRPPPYTTVDGENCDKYLYKNGEEVVVSVIRFSEMKRQEAANKEDGPFISQQKKQKPSMYEIERDHYQQIMAKIFADQAQQQQQQQHHASIPIPDLSKRSTSARENIDCEQMIAVGKATKATAKKLSSDNDNWVVVKDVYHPETISVIEREIFGKRNGYTDKDAAIKVAKWLLDNLACFQDWGSEFYEDQPPPYATVDEENCDTCLYKNGEEVLVSVMRISEMKRQEAANEKHLGISQHKKQKSSIYGIYPHTTDQSVIEDQNQRIKAKIAADQAQQQQQQQQHYASIPIPDPSKRSTSTRNNTDHEQMIEDQYQRLKAKIVAADQAQQQQQQHTGAPPLNPFYSTTNQSSSKTSQPTSRLDQLATVARAQYAHIPADLSKTHSTTSNATTTTLTRSNKKLRIQQSNDDNWVVVKDTYPSGVGCHLGQPRMSDAEFISQTEREVVGNKNGYSDKDNAITVAKCERDKSEWFDDWGSEYYGDRPPPYESVKARNFDNDEEVMISVMRISEMKREEEEDKKIIEKERNAAKRK